MDCAAGSCDMSQWLDPCRGVGTQASRAIIQPGFLTRWKTVPTCPGESRLSAWEDIKTWVDAAPRGLGSDVSNSQEIFSINCRNI